MSGVYVITDGKHCKIGKADNPHKRMQEPQTGNPLRLMLAFWVETPLGQEGQIESAAQRRLHQLRRMGEWFECDRDCAVWAVMAVLYPGCTVADAPEPDLPTDRLLSAVQRVQSVTARYYDETGKMLLPSALDGELFDLLHACGVQPYDSGAVERFAAGALAAGRMERGDAA
jgi:hypothetical protein